MAQYFEDHWKCEKCTLINRPTSKRCEACSSTRPGLSGNGSSSNSEMAQLANAIVSSGTGDMSLNIENMELLNKMLAERGGNAEQLAHDLASNAVSGGLSGVLGGGGGLGVAETDAGTGGVLNLDANYQGNESRVYASWRLTKEKWCDLFARGFRTGFYSEKFVIPCDGEIFTFRFNLNPAGCTDSQQASEKYGLYMQLLDKPTAITSISIVMDMWLAEIESHRFETTCTLNRACGVGPNLGFASIEEILSLEVEELTYIADLRITSALRPEMVRQAHVDVTYDYQGDPHRVLAEWHVPKSTWRTWRAHYQFQQHVDSKNFKVPFRGNQVEFHFSLNPNGRNDVQKSSGYYGLGVYMPTMPVYARGIQLAVASGVVGFPSHTREWTTTLTTSGGTAKYTGAGSISDLDNIDSDEIIFTYDVKIVDMRMKYEPMPKKCMDLLRAWKLEAYARPMEELGMIDDAFWHKIERKVLKDDIGMKPGEILRFEGNSRQRANFFNDEEKEHQISDHVYNNLKRQQYRQNSVQSEERLRMENARLRMQLEHNNRAHEFKEELRQQPSRRAIFFEAEGAGAQAYEDGDEIDTWISESSLRGIRDRNRKPIELGKVLKELGYETLELLRYCIEDEAEMVELCDELQLRMAWKRRFISAIKSIPAESERLREGLYEAVDIPMEATEETFIPMGVTRGGMDLSVEEKQSIVVTILSLNLEMDSMCRETILSAMNAVENPTVDSVLFYLLQQYEADYAILSEEINAEQYTPLPARTSIKDLKRILDEHEAWFRDPRFVSDKLLKMNREDALRKLEQKLGPKRPEIERTFDKLRLVYEEEEHRCCSNEDYFQSLIIYEKYSEATKRCNTVGSLYGATQHLQMSKKWTSQREWDECIDHIAACQAHIAEKFKDQKFRQPRENLLDLYPMTVLSQLKLISAIAPLADGLGPDRFYHSAGHKSLHRCFEKMALHSTRRWSTNVWDLCRALISFDSIKEITAALNKLMAMDQDETSNIEVINLKNRFKKEREDNWQDVMVHIRFTDEPEDERVICEVQLCLHQLTVVRRELGGHDEYASFRVTRELRLLVDPNKQRLKALLEKVNLSTDAFVRTRGNDEDEKEQSGLAVDDQNVYDVLDGENDEVILGSPRRTTQIKDIVQSLLKDKQKSDSVGE